MSRIFLSHSSANNGPAVALRDWLKAEGWDDVFLDLDPDRGIAAGERWETALNEAAYRCEAVLFLLSKSWLASNWCRKEFDLAAKLNKRMFGVLIEDLAIADLPRELTGTWQVVNLAQGSDQKLFETAMPGGAVHSASFSQGALRRLKTGLVKAGLDPRFFDWPPAHDPMRPPYRGLLPMEAEDAGIFYGREAPIIETLDKLRGLRQAATSRLLVILGASGSGKSSFLRAGIMPRLARDDRNFLMLPVVRPERAVISGETGLLRSLERAGAAHDLDWSRSEIDATIAAGGAGVPALIAMLARQTMPPRLGNEPDLKPPTLVLAIDQGEELFQTEGGEEAQAFLLLLQDMLASKDANLIVLFTIRSDAYATLQSEPLLKDIHQQPLNLPPVPRGAYQTIIEGPALRLKDTKRALKIDPQLTAALLADIETGGAKDALPLLAFALERLYLDHGGDGDLKLEEYRALGGIAGSIEAAVEQALTAADADPAMPKERPARLALLRRAFIPWLAGIDPETNTPRRAIARLSDIPEDSRSLIRHLIDRRLLATDRDQNGETTIEPAHEALLRQWGLLRSWLDEDALQLSALEGVRRATRDWLANGKSPDWLAHNAGRLEDAERLKARPDLAAKMVQEDLNYLVECRTVEAERKDKELRQARKLTRAIAVGLVAAVLLAVVAAGFGYYGFVKANEATEQATAATRNESVALAGLSKVALAEEYSTQAVKLALAAWPRVGDEGRPLLKRTIESLGVTLAQNRQRLLFRGHEDEVRSAVFSPDGTRVLTASADDTARLWDTKTGAEIAVLKGHTSYVRSAAFSADGTRIVTASWDGTARLWDVATGKEVGLLKAPEISLDLAVFTPDGARVFVASGNDGIVRVWDLRTQQIVESFGGYGSCFALSPDGKRIVIASTEGAVHLWDVASKQEVGSVKGHEDSVNSCAFSPDGTRVVTASSDRSARISDATTGREVSLLKGQGEAMQSAVFSPDGEYVLTASRDGTARLWFAPSGEISGVYRGNKASLVSAVFSPDGTRMATASADGTARLWDVRAEVEIAAFTGHEAALNIIAFSRDGSHIVTASDDKTARLWDATTGHQIMLLEGHRSSLQVAIFSPDGNHVATGGDDKIARLWDVKSGKTLAVLEGHEKSVTLAAFSPDGARLVTGSDDNTARLWDARTGSIIAILKGHTKPLRSVAVSSDGMRVATASSDKTARLWDGKTGTLVAVLEGHERGVGTVAFSSDATRLVTTSSDRTVRIWDVKTGMAVAVLQGPKTTFETAVFSPDGTSVLTASADNLARLWDVKTGTEKLVLKGHEKGVWMAILSPDGTRIVTASPDGTARVWDAKSGGEIAVLRGHEQEVVFADFSSDGTRILTRSLDKTARLWDAHTGVQLDVIKGRDEIDSAAFAPDGTRIVTASSNATATIWDISDLEKGDAFTVACERLGNDTDLADVRRRYGLGEMVPICGENAPLPVDIEKLQ